MKEIKTNQKDNKHQEKKYKKKDQSTKCKRKKYKKKKKKKHQSTKRKKIGIICLSSLSTPMREWRDSVRVAATLLGSGFCLIFVRVD
jgi:hypothetical protein